MATRAGARRGRAGAARGLMRARVAETAGRGARARAGAGAGAAGAPCGEAEALGALLRRRRACNKFKPGTPPVPEAILEAIVADASMAPSSFNLQHARYVLATSEEMKGEICEAAYGQPQVKECSVLVVVVANTRAHEAAADILAADGASVERTASVLEMVEGSYGGDGNPAARDEAFRSCGLAAMAFMLSAQARGYNTGPMSGFDPAAVGAAVGLLPGEEACMLIALGEPAVRDNGQDGGATHPRQRPARLPPSALARHASGRALGA